MAPRVVILAGGYGTRIDCDTIPKPMIDINGKPLMTHIMNHYKRYGFKKFVICCGYKGEYISRYYMYDTNCITIDTGLNTLTGGRIKKIRDFVDGTFMLTYGDGVSDINLKDLLKFHKNHGKAITISAVRLDGRFGKLELDGNRIVEFSEKPIKHDIWINGGFMVCEPKVFDYIINDEPFERGPLEALAESGEAYAYRHRGFWQCVDNYKDKEKLERLWTTKTNEY